MRSVIFALLGIVFTAVVGCGSKTKEDPKQSSVAPAPGASRPPAKSSPFEELFRGGRIAWHAVKNVEVTTKTPGGSNVESTEFRVKFNYDEFGRRSVDTTGQKTYSWPGSSAIFGPGAVIKVTEAVKVAEGDVMAGDDWVWDGAAWVSKKVFDEGLAKSEAKIIDQLGGSAVSFVVRDPGAAVDSTLDPLYARLNEQPGGLQDKIKQSRAEPRCFPAVAILKVPVDLGDIEKRFGSYQEKLDQGMRFPVEGGDYENKPVYWYRFGGLEIGVDFTSPVIVAVRIQAES